MILSKNKIKLINSLGHKKYRDELGLFVAEGSKSVLEMIQYFDCEILCATRHWLDEHSTVKGNEMIGVTEEELKKISFLKTPQKVLAVFKKTDAGYNSIELKKELSLALDNIQDPGNLGTIIRIADWFVIGHIFCSETTADVFNPKTVQATMGALGRVQVHYVDLQLFIEKISKDVPVFGTFLDGNNIYREHLPGNGVIIMGNEGNGISEKLAKFIPHKLLIPNFPAGSKTSESLNVAVATAIVCSEFRRKNIV